MDAKGNEDYLVSLNVTPMVSLGVSTNAKEHLSGSSYFNKLALWEESL